MRVELTCAERRKRPSRADLAGLDQAGQVVAKSHRAPFAVALHGAVGAGGDEASGLIEERCLVLAVKAGGGRHVPVVLHIAGAGRVGLQPCIELEAGCFDLQRTALQRFSGQGTVVIDLKRRFVTGSLIEQGRVGQAGIGIVRRQLGHGHRAFDQPVQRRRRKFRDRDHGLFAADEDAQAEIGGFVALDGFQFALAHTDAQGAAFGEDGLGRVGPGRTSAGDEGIQGLRTVFGRGEIGGVSRLQHEESIGPHRRAAQVSRVTIVRRRTSSTRAGLYRECGQKSTNNKDLALGSSADINSFAVSGYEIAGECE